MATKKIAITLESEQVDRIRNLVATGQAVSMSGFVQHAVGVALDDVAGWGAMLAVALAESGGAMSADELEWADQTLGVSKRRRNSPRLMPGVTLDAGVLIALDRNDRRLIVLLARALETNSRITIPASALAQAIRRAERQARLSRLLRQASTDVIALDRVDAVQVGRLRRQAGHRIRLMLML